MSEERMTIHELVCKLVGNIDPVGETHTDDRRFENLKVMTNLVDKLLFDINSVSHNKDRHEFSMKRAGEYAGEFFDEIRAME